MKYPADFIEKKNKNQKWSMLTAYDAPTATLLQEQGIDAILVGDSLGNVIAGLENTLNVTLEQMIYHTQLVKRGAPASFIITDMPFMSYPSPEQGLINAGRLIKEGGASAVKLETHPCHIPLVKRLCEEGIPTLSHVGFTPQFLFQLGGYKIQGKTQKAAAAMLTLCQELEKAGSFGIVLEMIPSDLAKKITSIIKIPTIGIGAGPYCDGQVLVTQDLLGLNPNKIPRFVKQYAQLYPEMENAISTFKQEVEKGQFPSDEHQF